MAAMNTGGTEHKIDFGPLDIAESKRIARMSKEWIERGLGWSWRAPRIWRAIASSQVLTVGARVRGELVGFALMKFSDEATQAHLLLFAVDPDWRRKGIGRALIAWLEESACIAGTQRVFLEVRASASTARAFYRRIGFESVARIRGYYRGKEDAIRMCKVLAEPDSLTMSEDPMARILADVFAEEE